MIERGSPGHPLRSLLTAAMAVAVGTTISVQSRVNGEFSHASGSSLLAAWWTMITGLAILGLSAALDRRVRRGLRGIWSGVRSGVLPYWTLAGGLFGATFLICQSLVVPLTGVAVFVVGSIAGQTTSSILIDRLGISASGVRPISVARVIAALIAIAAVAVGVSGGSQQHAISIGLGALAFLAGSCVAPQQAANGRTAVAGGSAIASALVNFIVGAALLSVVLGILLSTRALVIQSAYVPPWWAFLGGLCGVAIVGMSAFVVPTLGILLFSLLSVTGQLGAGFLIDLLAPTVGASVGLRLLMGLLLAGLSVAVATASQWRFRSIKSALGTVRPGGRSQQADR